MEPFLVGVDITDVNSLYGRKRQIDILSSCAKRRGNAGIIGARRFGKTCLLKSLDNYLRHSDEFDAYPIYFDVKTQTGINKDTPAVYRSLAALLASKMCSDGMLSEGDFKISRRRTLDVSDDKLDMLVQMKEWEPEYQKEVLFLLSNKVAEFGKYVLLLLDEIDFLLLEALESPSDFSRIRGAATDKNCSLKFWIAGTSTWSSICTTIGSPELNCGLENVSLPPLNKEEFEEMWGQECSFFDDTEQRNAFLSIGDTVYRNTGGIPYYAKFVGSHMINNGTIEVPDYQIIRDYLTEIVNNRFTSDVERSVLFLLSSGEKVFEDTIPDGVSGLMSKGLLKVDGNRYSIGIGYLFDYLIARKQDTSISNVKEIEEKELHSLVDQISRLRHNINIAYRGQEPFTASTEDNAEFNILKIVCHNEATIDAFSGSLYKLYYEGSKLGQDLPEKFRNDTFSNMVRALRHLYNHRDCVPTSMTMNKLLALVCHGRMPFKEEDYCFMQKIMLDTFHKELLDILSEKSKLHPTKIHEKNNGSSKIVSGIFRKGFAGRKDSVEQDSTGYFQQVRTIRAGETITDGDEVLYNLCNEPKPQDPTSLFWYAEDVHLKVKK